MKRIVLASDSARRAALLELAELPFIIMPSFVNEDFEKGDTPEEVVRKLAVRKAEATFEKLKVKKDYFIIGSDTIVVNHSEEIINKPQNFEEAVEILTGLSGITHKVITGVCILNGEKKSVFSETTLVTFKELKREYIEYYIRKHHPFDKAGSYAIQEWIGVIGVTKIQGDYYNVMGLPVNKVVEELERLGFPLPYTSL